MEIGWIMGILFVFLTIIYFVLAIFFPELVGIQGKIARQIEADHVDDKAKEEKKD